MKELARSTRRGANHDVYLIGGGTAVMMGWRESTVDADLYSDREDIFRDIQNIKERLQINVEFARPEDFVPPLAGSEERHLFIDRIGSVRFYHYDPYAQMLSKIVRGFAQDLDDASAFLDKGLVDGDKFRNLVYAIPDAAYAKYPAISSTAVRNAVDIFLKQRSRS